MLLGRVCLRFLQQSQSEPVTTIATAKPARVDPTTMGVVEDVDLAAGAVLLAETDTGREVPLVRDVMEDDEVEVEVDDVDVDDVKSGSRDV